MYLLRRATSIFFSLSCYFILSISISRSKTQYLNTSWQDALAYLQRVIYSAIAMSGVEHAQWKRAPCVTRRRAMGTWSYMDDTRAHPWKRPWRWISRAIRRVYARSRVNNKARGVYQARTRETSCTYSSLESDTRSHRELCRDTQASNSSSSSSMQHVAVYGIRDSHWMPREPRRHRACGRPWPWVSTRTVKRGERTGPLTTAGEPSFSSRRTLWILTRLLTRLLSRYRSAILLCRRDPTEYFNSSTGTGHLVPKTETTCIRCKTRNVSSRRIETYIDLCRCIPNSLVTLTFN